MAAVLRVKRRNEDEPFSALVIASKRCKIAEDDEAEPADSTPVTTILKFAGTVKNQEEDVVKHLVKTLRKDELKSNFKQHPVDILRKVREKTKEVSAESRYKVVNCFRSLDTSNIEELEENVMTVIDVEDSLSCSAANDALSKKDDTYVYDLYYAQTKEEMYTDDVAIHGLNDELYFGPYREEDSSDTQCESEDSNSESNWRNDYPDSDYSEDSINEDDMRHAVMNMKLEDGPDLSSDDDFVYAVDERDVEQYGYKYARYKAKVKEEMDGSSSDDSNSDSYVSDESDQHSEDDTH